MTPDPLAEFLTRARACVDVALERYLPLPPACPAIVAEAMRYSVFAGGKRLRPMLTLAAAEAVAQRIDEDRRHAATREQTTVWVDLPAPVPRVSETGLGAAPPASAMPGDPRPRALDSPSSEGERLGVAFDLALPAACAIEMIHTYSLIHDDLPAMDNDTLRRGRPTLHVIYGDGIAILAGDGLHAEAFTLLARQPASDDPDVIARKLAVIRLVGEAAGAAGMVGGQAIDLQAGGQAPGRAITVDAEQLRSMHALKTGALIRASAVSGAIMAGADATLTAAIDAYASEIGLAFQIVDDILDVEGDAASLGKTTGKDAALAKPTYPALFGLDRSRALAAECLRRAHEAIEGAGITHSLLGAIADWVVSRKS